MCQQYEQLVASYGYWTSGFTNYYHLEPALNIIEEKFRRDAK